MTWSHTLAPDLRPDAAKILGQSSVHAPKVSGTARQGLRFPDGISIVVTRQNTAHAVDADDVSAFALAALSGTRSGVRSTLCGQMLLDDVIFDVWPRTDPWGAWPCQTCANTLKRASGGITGTPSSQDGKQ